MNRTGLLVSAHTSTGLLVSAHTSAGKTAVADYAIAMDFRDKQRDTFTKQKVGDGGKSANGRSNSRIAKGGKGSGGGSDIYKIVKMIMDRKFQPFIIFSFGRRECAQHAMSMSKLDFNTQEEKDVVENVFCNGVLCLSEKDRSLPAIELILPLLLRGIAVHHTTVNITCLSSLKSLALNFS